MPNPSMPLIRLYDLIGASVIVGFPSGVRYSNQTCGTMCNQPEYEGVVVPLRNELYLEPQRYDGPETDLLQYFSGPKHQCTGAPGGLDSEDVDFIEGVLRKYRLEHCIAIDREEIEDSHEAWVHVLVTADEGGPRMGLFHGFGPYPRKGVLTWCNSD